MKATFLPSQVHQLKDATAIALLRGMQRKAIATPLRTQPVLTTYVCQGQGEIPILLLHGFDSSVLEFRSLLPLLAKKNETWAVDLLGFGFGERVQDITYSPLAIKTHLYCFWKTLIDQPIVLVGASMGGAAAIDFTLTYPEVVKAIVLIDSVGYTNTPEFVKFLFPPLDYLAVEYLRQRQLLALNFGSVLSYLNPSWFEAIQCAALHQQMPGWHESTSSFTKSGGYSDIANQIAQVDKPTLILWGENDNILNVGDAERFQQAITGSVLYKLKNCGHVPQLEQPQITAKHISEFSYLLEKSAGSDGRESL